MIQLQRPEPTRLQLELRDDAWLATGPTILAWPALVRYAQMPAVTSMPAIAECACPVDCIRDHETD